MICHMGSNATFLSGCFFTFEMFTLPKLCGFPVSHLADTDALSAALGHRSSAPAARAIPGTLERLPQCNICGLEDFFFDMASNSSLYLYYLCHLRRVISNLDPPSHEGYFKFGSSMLCYRMFQDASLSLNLE